MGADRTIRGFTRAGRILRPRTWAPRRSFALTVNWACFSLVCWYKPHRGYRPHTLTRYTANGGAVVSGFAVPEATMKKRVVNPSPGPNGPQHLAAVESDVLVKFPALVAHCAVTRYEDGDPRRPGWFTIKTLGSAWVIQVKEPDAAASLTATGQSLDDALTLAELLLSSEEAPWEPDPFLKKQQGSRRV